jgi:hypothetical protein
LKVPVVACAVLALGLTLAACGGGGNSGTGTESTATAQKQVERDRKPPGQEAQGAKPGAGGGQSQAGEGAAEFRVEGGDNSVQEFGAEAGRSELEEAAAALHGFLDARVARDWSKACTYLTKATAESVQRLAGSSKQSKGRDCGATLEAVSKGVPQGVLEEAAQANVGALRTEGDRAFILYHGAANTDYVIPMAQEGGAWKVAALAGTPLS